jgi:hypothetical protein
MEKPSIGRIVHFVSSNGIHHASIVTSVRRVALAGADLVIDRHNLDFIVACFALAGFLFAVAGLRWPSAGCMVLVSLLTLWRLGH